MKHTKNSHEIELGQLIDILKKFGVKLSVQEQFKIRASTEEDSETVNITALISIQKHIKTQKIYQTVNANESDSDEHPELVDMNGYIGEIRRTKEKLISLSFD